MKLTSNDIQRLISGRETASFECKEAKGGLPDSLWESYSAFANTDGGVILLGVREADGRLTASGVANAKYGFADPKITESFDPERTLVEVELNAEKEDVGQNVGQKRSYVGQKVGQNRSYVGQKVGQNVGQKSLLSRPSAANVPGDLTASAKQVLSSLREDSTLTHRGLAAKLGFAETTIDRAFSLLIRRGLVRRVGPKKGGHWETT